MAHLTSGPAYEAAPGLSVIIPCHNEAQSIQAVLERIRRVVPRAEVIVVDDGSTDHTAGVASRVPGVQVLRLGRNQGKGVALRRGIEAAMGDRLLFIDGDGQDSPEDILPMLSRAEAGSPFVNGSKFSGEMEPGSISRPNYMGNRFMSGLINRLFGAAVTDSQSGFRLISRRVIRGMRLTASQYEIETEMLCQALKAGVQVDEVPVTRKARTGGSTGFRRVRNGSRVLLMILKQRFL